MIRIAEPQELDEFLEGGKERSEDCKALVLRLVNQLGKVNEVSAITGVPEATIYKGIREWNKERPASLESQRGEGGGREVTLMKARIVKGMKKETRRVEDQKGEEAVDAFRL
jgi:transposase